MSQRVAQGDFAVQITTSNGGYASLIPNSYRPFFQLDEGTYCIQMANNGPTKADAQVFVDGEDCGLFRIEARSSHGIEHPQFINKKFTFKSAKNFTESSYQSNVEPQNGKISVVFTPEKSNNHAPSTAIPYQPRISSTKLEGKSGYTPDVNYSLYDAGTTVLGEQGTPYNTMVAPITDVDNERVTIIDAWLVVKK